MPLRLNNRRYRLVWSRKALKMKKPTALQEALRRDLERKPLKKPITIRTMSGKRTLYNHWDAALYIASCALALLGMAIAVGMLIYVAAFIK